MAVKMTNNQASATSNIAPLVRQEQDIQTLSRLAGLEGALALFPEDVTTAARTALSIRAAFQAPIDNTAELWPVMEVKS